MTNNRIIIVLLYTILASSFYFSTAQNSLTYYPKDTITSFKLENLWVTPKNSFLFNSLGNISKDTLHLVSCSNYVYFPFGKLTDSSSLSTSLLKDFTITSFKQDTFTNTNMKTPFFEWHEYIDISLANNKLALYLDNDPEASKHGYIQNGKITDSNVTFIDNIKVGMSIEEFYQKFFDYFPKELIAKYKVIKLESCVMDVTHFYLFVNGCLNSVYFITE